MSSRQYQQLKKEKIAIWLVTLMIMFTISIVFSVGAKNKVGGNLQANLSNTKPKPTPTPKPIISPLKYKTHSSPSVRNIGNSTKKLKKLDFDKLITGIKPIPGCGYLFNPDYIMEVVNSSRMKPSQRTMMSRYILDIIKRNVREDERRYQRQVERQNNLIMFDLEKNIYNTALTVNNTDKIIQNTNTIIGNTAATALNTNIAILNSGKNQMAFTNITAGDFTKNGAYGIEQNLANTTSSQYKLLTKNDGYLLLFLEEYKFSQCAKNYKEAMIMEIRLALGQEVSMLGERTHITNYLKDTFNYNVFATVKDKALPPSVRKLIKSP